MMIIPSTILILFAFSLLACFSDNDKLGGGAVEGNTVEAEYKVEPVQIDSEKIVVGESAIDSHPKEFDNCEWYSILLNSPRETYFEFFDDIDASESCQERGGVFQTPPGGCVCGVRFTCTIEQPFLTKPVRETLEDVAEQLNSGRNLQGGFL